jgi:hypothetical protein
MLATFKFLIVHLLIIISKNHYQATQIVKYDLST